MRARYATQGTGMQVRPAMAVSAIWNRLRTIRISQADITSGRLRSQSTLQHKGAWPIDLGLTECMRAGRAVTFVEDLGSAAAGVCPVRYPGCSRNTRNG